ncbi:MAG: PRC-barrel domain-containing protein [Candidatus Njordarchaeales archaeon]
MLGRIIGKKVFTVDGEEIGIIKDLIRDELGYEIAIIKTVFNEIPEIRTVATNLRRAKRNSEDIYILRTLPIKLKHILKEIKRRKEIEEFEKKFLSQKRVDEDKGESNSTC